MNRAMYLTTGEAYDVAKLRLACWRDADGDLLLPTTDLLHWCEAVQSEQTVEAP